jgi:hypothetical protein
VEGSCEHGNEPLGSGEFLSKCTTGSACKRAQLRGVGFITGPAVSEVVRRRLSTAGFRVRTQVKSWGLWCKKWHRGRFNVSLYYRVRCGKLTSFFELMMMYVLGS